MKIKLLFTKKRIIWGVVVIIIVGGLFYLFFLKKDTQQETVTVHPADFLQQVSVSGKVTATENLDLSFEQAGIIRGVYVKVGDNITVGKFLVSQDTAQLSTQLQEMQAGIDLQKAKLSQLLAGASSEDIKIKQDAVVLAQQDLRNAYDGALITLNSAYNAIYSAYTVALYIQRTYFIAVDQEGTKVQNAKDGISHSLANAKSSLDNGKSIQDLISLAITNISLDLNSTYAYLKVIRDQCDEGVYYLKVSGTDKTSLDTQRASINTASNNIASSKQSINSYVGILKQAQNQLDLLNAPSRPTDIAVFEAQIKQAEASAQNVLTQIRKRQIFSPISGIITLVDAKVGSILSSGQIATSVISSGKFNIESYVPEIYISLVHVGNDADITLDSYGPDKTFKAKVISIDPSETVKDGVSTYKIKLELQDGDEVIKDGMTANVIITTKKKANTISVLQGIVISKDGKKFIKVKNGDSVVEREVTLGDFSSSGQVEIASGLNNGDVVIIK